LADEPTNMLHLRLQSTRYRVERLTLPPPLPDLALLSRREPVVTHPTIHPHMIK
jgi:hypothetical protein